MSSERATLEAARERLLAALGALAADVSLASLQRCPYRTRSDVCTFRGECRNRILQARSRAGCSGAVLDARPVGQGACE